MTALGGEALAAAPTRSAAEVWRFVGRYGTLILLALMILVFALLEPSTFATKDNLVNVLNQSALAAIISIGLTFPLVAGEFDLSVGYQASFAGVVCAGLMERTGLPIAAAIAAVLVLGAAIGLVNGLIVTRIGVNALIATLGIGTIVVGLNYAYANGLPIQLADPAGFIELSLGEFLGIPYPVYAMFVVAGVAWVVLNRTAPGYQMQAVGGNPVAARLSGIRVDRIRTLVFVIAGVCAALTGILLAARTGSGAVDAGDSFLLSAFAACFFGSSVLRDGQFHIGGTIVGVLAVSIGFNAIAILGLNTYTQYLLQGGLLIVGVGVGTLARRYGTR
jgi:ribose transport system permease protein